MNDLIIIGGGPAGLSAAIYAVRYKLKTLLITKELGGDLNKIHLIENYPGFSKISGLELSKKFEEQLKNYDIEIKQDEVIGIRKEKNFIVNTRKEKFESKKIILALGSEKRKLNLENEEKFLGKGISYCYICSLPGTKILTESGLKNIEDIKKGDNIFSHLGTYDKVIEPTKTYYEGPIVSIQTRLFRDDEIKLTSTHYVSVIETKKCYGLTTCKPLKKHTDYFYKGYKFCKGYYKAYKPKWVPAAWLNKDQHMLLYPIPKEIKDIREIKVSNFLDIKIDEGENVYNKRETYTAVRIPNKILIKSNFLRLIGYYIAEGFIATNNTGICFTFNKKERKYIEDIKKTIRDIFKLNPREITKDNVTLIYVYSKILGRFFKQEFGSLAYKKHLPNWALKLPPNKQKEIIKTMWWGDGCKREKDFCYVTTSEELAQQLKIVLLRLGIIPRVGVRKKDDLNKKNHKIENRIIRFNHNKYHIMVGGPYLKKAGKILEIEHKNINSRNRVMYYGWIHKNYAYLPIKEIKFSKYKGYVYNAAINNSNSYVTKTMALHNCDAPFYKDRIVGIIGGSYSAVRSALLLIEYAKKVYIIYRGDKLRGDPIENERVLKNKKVEFVKNANIVKLNGDKFLESIELNNGRKIKLDGLFIEIGSVPNTALVKELGIKIDENGFIIIDETKETNVKGVFAAGDTTNTKTKQIIIAAAEGAVAATSVFYQIKGD